MKRQQRTVGAFIKIQYDKEYHTYARILKNANFAIYDYRTKKDIEDLDKIAASPVLFIVAVYNDAVTRGRWLKVGNLPIESSLEKLPLKFIQNSINPRKFRIYDPNTGLMHDTSREECEGLECAAVWEPEAVEQRISDYYANKPNETLEMLKIKD